MFMASILSIQYDRPFCNCLSYHCLLHKIVRIFKKNENSVFPAVLCRLQSSPHRKEERECKTVAHMNTPFHIQMVIKSGVI